MDKREDTNCADELVSMFQSPEFRDEAKSRERKIFSSFVGNSYYSNRGRNEKSDNHLIVSSSLDNKNSLNFS